MENEEVIARGNYERIEEEKAFITHKVNGEKYVLLCLFNEQWAYSRIGKDKIFSPTKIIMNL